MKVSRCPACGAPVPPTTTRCAYCQSYLVPNAEEREQPSTASPSADVGGFTFIRQAEPNERAFTMALPYGWLMEGGISRADLTRQMIDAQSIQAKLDLTVKCDEAGTVALRWCPEMKYCDMRMSPAGMMGLFPTGSNYQGMIVSPVMSPQDFLAHVVFPWAHPAAEQVQVIDQRDEPALVEHYRQSMAALGLPTQGDYAGSVITYTYVEEGQPFQENGYTVIENMGRLAGGMWSNKNTLLIRTPPDAFETWEPMLRHILASVEINPQWLAWEIANQDVLSRSFLNAQQASIARDRRMMEILNHMQQVDREITEHRSRTNAEIQNDAYLTLMEQEEYVNPHNGEIDVGSNQWQHRWTTEDGAEFYTDNETHDPNTAGLLNRSDWKRSRVRPRFPQ